MIEENKEKGIMVDLYLHDFAKSLAKNINNKNLSTSLKNQIGKQFDGDYDVLLEDFYKKNPTFKGILENSKEYEKYDLGLAKLFINISMPVNFEKWDSDNFKPLVAVKSVFYDEKSNNKIIAYDSNGKSAYLDSKITPNVPIIVIGLNERIFINEDNQVELKSAYKKANQLNSIKTNVVDVEVDILDPDGSSGGGGPVPNNGPGTGKYHVNQCYEYLTAINCTDINQYEGWIAGAPELRLKVHYADFNQGKIADNAAVDILLEPDTRGDINNTWWTLPFDQQIWVWDYTGTGTNQLYSWYEEDESISFSADQLIPIAANFKILTTLPGGFYTFAAIVLAKTITIKGSTEFIGQVEVNARPNIFEYGVGTGLRFRSRTKTCAEVDQPIFNNVTI